MVGVRVTAGRSATCSSPTFRPWKPGAQSKDPFVASATTSNAPEVSSSEGPTATVTRWMRLADIGRPLNVVVTSSRQRPAVSTTVGRTNTPVHNGVAAFWMNTAPGHCCATRTRGEETGARGLASEALDSSAVGERGSPRTAKLEGPS